MRDSKKLSAKQREEWFALINQHPKIMHARASVYPKTIDRINISNAANLAAVRALEKLLARHKIPGRQCKVLLDGGLFLKTLNSKSNILNPRTIVKGDEKFNAIKLASIVAKVNRDRIISNNDREYPEYGLAQHKGYATRVHRKAVRKYGPSEIHRLSFLTKII